MPPRRILVVDDIPQIRDLVGTVLETQIGCIVTSAGDGHAALTEARAAASRGSPFDLLITDLHMPPPQGHELWRTIKQEALIPAGILMTTDLTRDAIVEFDGALIKPFDVDDLEGLVLDLLPNQAFS